MAAFIASATPGRAPGANSRKSPRRPRRAFLGYALSAATGALLASSTAGRAAEQRLVGKSAKQWSEEELCNSCAGSGKQSCSMCSGSGVLSIDDSVVQQDLTCPTCMGQGSVRCPACIGLGLADTNGILRDGVKDGTLRMLRNGSYEILDCSAFPACDIYGAPSRSHM